MDSAVADQIKKALIGGETKELVDPYLLFSFAGKEVSLKYSLISIDLVLVVFQLAKPLLNYRNTAICFYFVLFGSQSNISSIDL